MFARHVVELNSPTPNGDSENMKEWAERQVYDLPGCYNPWNMQTRDLATD